MYNMSTNKVLGLLFMFCCWCFDLLLTMIGVCYNDGTGVPLSYEDAVTYYELASAKGNAMAMCNLGTLC